ncbi:MAG TPA: T9SS type A sorting domain-containing protein [Candidatus Kapabacteria bacterium]|nr:T9SS type A sorting domain-containing protein [Candidatus Kapabacteria bacterium]
MQILTNRILTIIVACLVTLLCCTHDLYAQWQWTHGPDGGRVLGMFANNSVLLTLTDSGVFRALGQNISWNKNNLSDSDSFVPWSGSGFAAMGQYLFVGGYRMGIYRSLDDGVSWKNLRGPNNITGLGVIGSKLFASSSYLSVNVSTDSGETWNIDSPDGAQNGGNPNRIYFLETVGSSVFISGAGGPRHSTDSGMTWSGVNIDKGFNNYGGFGSIILGFDPDSVFLSFDKGSTWNSASNRSLPNASINCFVISDTEIFIGGSHGVFSSIDTGRSWTAQNKGIPNDSVTQLTIGEGYLYAGFAHKGVWRRNLSDISAIEESHVQISSLQLSPNPAAGIITIYNLPEDLHDISIFNILGERVLGIQKPQGGEVTLNVSNFPAGIYFVNLGGKTYRFVKVNQ